MMRISTQRRRSASGGGLIAAVAPGSPADRAGLQAGMVVMSVDGQPLLDILDWLWMTDGDLVWLGAGQLQDFARGYRLEREPHEPWGIEFASPLFDGVRTCTNACRFCFIDMLPKGLRESLYLRDDDYRLSFLQGNFVTLTNLDANDIERIVSLRLTPLHVSLHAVDPEVRRQMMGANAPRGLEALERLLDAGIEAHVQIVLMPGVNDGDVLAETLDYIAARPGILSAGIVPYAVSGAAAASAKVAKTDRPPVTSEADAAAPGSSAAAAGGGAATAGGGAAASGSSAAASGSSAAAAGGAAPAGGGAAAGGAATAGGGEAAGPAPAARLTHNAEQAGQLIDSVLPLAPRVQLADDWFLLAGRPLPTADYYLDYPQHENGIGMLRSFIDDWPHPGGGEDALVQAADAAGASTDQPALAVTGTAFAPTLNALVASSPLAQRIQVVPITNRFFGGSVNVTGLLTAADIAAGLAEMQVLLSPYSSLLVPSVIFNSDGLTLDDCSAEELAGRLGRAVHVVPYGQMSE